ncbi:peptidase [Aestuariibius insulae]|uniref:peptidase n=1 Tax=Aestuariibius insulae TaxID=2058287 RepID=UPI00345E17DE
MTYCVGMRLDQGLVFMSDTRTNAGIDNISIFQKLHTWSIPGERVVTVMTSGNLATTQAVISMLDERMKAPVERSPSLLEAPSMFQVARMIGETVRDVIAEYKGAAQQSEGVFDATIIVGGQIKGSAPRLFLVYPEGNFVEAGDDTPFFQIGETKYGRPIIVRAYRSDMSFEEATRLLLVSFDSTIKANLSVGPPLDLQVYAKDSYEVGFTRRFEAEDDLIREVSSRWGEALGRALESLPMPEFDL